MRAVWLSLGCGAAEGWGQAGSRDVRQLGGWMWSPGACGVRACRSAPLQAWGGLCPTGAAVPVLFLTVAVTCLGNHLELFIVNYKHFYFLL